ncbi:hypothetical protein NMG60_11037022 [Bertholletia excelsa]
MKKKQKNNPSPPWQDLDPFILSKIFSFLPLPDLLFSPPFVCRTWLSATLDTLFPTSTLDLRQIDTLDCENQQLRFTHLLKLALAHYSNWVSVFFPSKHSFGYFATVYISERTPTIKSVILPSGVCLNMIPIFISVLYWKKIRVFRAKIHPEIGFLLISQLVDFCKEMVELGLCGTLMEREISCLVEGFERIEVLDLSGSTLSCNGVEILLDGRLKWVKEISILHCKILGSDGKDIKEDYVKLKEFRDRVLERASGLRRLKSFLHCLVKNCPDCKEISSIEDTN